MSIRKNLFVGVIALGLSPLALASGYVAPVEPCCWEQGVYIGLQAGYGMTNWDALENYADMIAMGLVGTAVGVGIDDTDAFAGRVSIGYDFHKNFAIEAGYSQFFNHPSVSLPDGGSFEPYGNTYAIDLMGVIKANVVDCFGLYAKLGVDYLHTNSGDNLVVENRTFDFGDPHNFNVAYGAGLYYDFTKNFSMDASWMRYNGNQKFLDDNYQPFADLFTIGAKYKFTF